MKPRETEHLSSPKAFLKELETTSYKLSSMQQTHESVKQYFPQYHFKKRLQRQYTAIRNIFQIKYKTRKKD